MADLNLDDPIAVLIAAAGAFQRSGIDALVYGGMALAMYGEPRETRDADLAVASVSVDAARDALMTTGLTTVIAFSGTTFGGLSISRLTLVGGGKLNMVDLIRPRSDRFANAMMQRPLRGALEGQDLSVVSPEDFVLLKVLSTRDKDLEDARTIIVALRGRLDERLIRDEAALLAAEIPDHAVAARLLSVL
ncbi:MAG TPA: nucleotidyltransferase [Kofleriaceae bacterium]